MPNVNTILVAIRFAILYRNKRRQQVVVAADETMMLCASLQPRTYKLLKPVTIRTATGARPSACNEHVIDLADAIAKKEEEIR